MSDPGLGRLLAAMPKAELHVHLDGCMRVETALDLARSRDVDAPRTFEGMRALLVPTPRLASQAELLRAFELPVRLMQDVDALARVARELVEDKAADGVRYLEIKWAPALHTEVLDLAAVIEAVCAGTAEAATAAGIAVTLTVVAVRSHPPASSVRLASVAAEQLTHGLTGFDFAGDESGFPDPRPHRRAFDIAREAGLGITIHAGELRDGGAGVARALEISPHRIAHGVSAVDDSDVCLELRRRHVTLDLCPTSNVQAASVPSLATHPLKRLHRLGVPVSLSTDDTTISDVTLTEEYLRSAEEIGLRLDELWTINRHALDVAFAGDDVLDPLRAEFDAWADQYLSTPLGRHLPR